MVEILSVILLEYNKKKVFYGFIWLLNAHGDQKCNFQWIRLSVDNKLTSVASDSIVLSSCLYQTEYITSRLSMNPVGSLKDMKD